MWNKRDEKEGGGVGGKEAVARKALMQAQSKTVDLIRILKGTRRQLLANRQNGHFTDRVEKNVWQHVW